MLKDPLSRAGRGTKGPDQELLTKWVWPWGRLLAFQHDSNKYECYSILFIFHNYKLLAVISTLTLLAFPLKERVELSTSYLLLLFGRGFGIFAQRSVEGKVTRSGSIAK